jgi:hypothetical protein
MSWNNIVQTEQNLATVLNSFDWTSSSEIVESLIRDINRQTELLPERAAKSILGRLRRKGRLASGIGVLPSRRVQDDPGQSSR